MKRILLLFLLTSPFCSVAQLDEDYEYSKEFIWGINKNTNGGKIGGLVFRWSRELGNDIYRTIGFELSNVHHPKELRYPAATGSGGTFLFGKSNYLYTIRLQYGREKIFFRKDTQQGVQINAGFSGGPTLGFHSPYYVLSRNGEYEIFDPITHPGPGTIVGPGKLFQGLAQSDKVIGINVKGGISFEFGTYKNNVAGIETGIMFEAYPKEIVLVPTQSNRSIFSSIYFNLYWGKRK